MKIKHHIIPIFVPHVGCPHDCVFCNQKKITGLSTDMTKEEVDNTIKSYLKTIPTSNQKLEVAFYGGSFTAIDKEIQKELLSIANKYKKKGLIDRIRLSTRPDAIDTCALNLLKEQGVDIIELGVQSLSQDVLDKSNRGHLKEDVYEAVRLIKKYKFKLGLQMMIGLLGDTSDKSIYTASEIIKLKPDLVRIYPTLVVKDTFLETLYNENKYSALSLEEATKISSIILMMFEINDINVIRVGLQPTENICSESGEVVAGPFHPSFRQIVESNIYAFILTEFFRRIDVKSEAIEIQISKREISNLVGQNGINKDLIKKEYKLKKISIKGIEQDKDSFYIIIDGVKHIVNRKTYISKYLKSIDISV